MRSATWIEEETISEAFAALACAENGHRRSRVRVYVVDALVLSVTEREPAPRASQRAAAPEGREAGVPAGEADQRRTTVEAVTGRRVSATLSGQHRVPDVGFELFVLESA